MIKNRFFIFTLTLTFFFSFGNIRAFWRKKITLKNDTSHTFFYAPYYTTSRTGRQIESAHRLAPGQKTSFQMPIGKPFRSRTVIIAPTADQLPASMSLTENKLNSTNSAPVGLGHATELSITQTSDLGIFVQPTNAHQIAQERALDYAH